MEITWYGHSCFRMMERSMAAVVTDPYQDEIGYSPLKLRADIVTISHDSAGHNHADAVKGQKRVLTGPGEYEFGGVFITGLLTTTPGDKRKKSADVPRNTLYLFDFDGLNVCHLGDLDHVPTQTQIESLGAVHVALVPVGAGGALNAAQAAEVISLLEPAIVIPMHYRTEATATTLKLDPVGKFLKEMGLGASQPEPMIKVTKSNLPDETHVVLLDYKSA
jgi:L-ascorbate metabolism protein UlaG (beta-lactamase superfamily)